MKSKCILLLTLLCFSCSSQISSIENSSEQITIEKKYTSLTELTPFEKVDGYCEIKINKNCLGSDVFMLNGFPIQEGISMHPNANDDSSITYDISKYNYDTFVATIGKNDQQQGYKVKFYVYVDEELKYESNYLQEAMMEDIKIDISGAKKLKLVVNNGGDGHSFDASTWGYPTLINEKDLKITSIIPENINYITCFNKDLDINNFSAIIKYNCGYFKRVNKGLSINDYDKEKVGLQEINIIYEDFSFPYKIYCLEEKDFEKINKKNIKEYASLNDRITFGKEYSDGSEFSIAGIRYQNGIGLHPLSDTKPAYISFDVTNYNRFHSVIGKTRYSLRNEVCFYIYGDDNLLYKSKFLIPSEYEVVDISILGIKTLKVVIDDGDDGKDYDSSGLGDTFIYNKL